MALPEKINIGTAPNNGTGDPLRTAFQKSNAREDYLEANKLDKGNFEGTADDLKALITGVKWKDVAILATTENIVLSGEQVIDGVQTNETRVLVKNQNTFADNGIYITSAGAWVRAEDTDTGTELENATLVVTSGAENSGKQFTCTSTNITLGTTAIIWKHIANHESGTAEDPASIKLKYESNADTNAFTDAEQEKLANLENYDDTALAQRVSDAEDDIDSLEQNKVDNSRVLTDVPENAVFTDTVYNDTALSQRVTEVENNKANDSEVVKTVNGVEPDEDGNVVVDGGGTDFDDTAIQNTLSNHETRITALEGAATPQEPISVVWNTGDPLTFSLPKAPSAVDINGSMLSKWQEDEVTPDQWSLDGNTVTVFETDELYDGSNIQFHFSSGGLQGAVKPEDTTFFKASINLFNPNDPKIVTGKYLNSSTGEPTLTNSAYNTSGFIKITENVTDKKIWGTKESGGYTLRFVSFYDADKVHLSTVNNFTDNQDIVTGAEFFRTSYASDIVDYQLEINETASDYVPYGYNLDPNYNPVIEESEYGDIKVSLPSEICVAVGRTIEIYNKQIAWTGNINNYHFFWSGVGKSMKRKWTLTGVTEGEHTLTLKVYDNNTKLITEATTTVKIVSDTVTPFSIVTIGDSLTNTTSSNKPWMGEIRTLCSNAVDFVGTRGLSAGEMHEGRSGWKPYDYLIAREYTYEEEGVHPFWDGSSFSWNHYKTSTGISPDKIMIWLGTNGIASGTPTTTANHIKTMIDLIRADDATIPIFLVNTLYRANQDGIGKQTGNDGYVANSAWKLNEDLKVFELQDRLFNILDGYSNLHFIPVAACHDSEYNFGAVETPVNPRASQTELMPVEATHPQEQGYLQIADIIYSSLAAHQ